jgi:hypothetical protein
MRRHTSDQGMELHCNKFSRGPPDALEGWDLSDLKPGDFVIVECGSCGHDGLIHPAALPSLGLGSNKRIVDLAPRLRCRECDARGKLSSRSNEVLAQTNGDPIEADRGRHGLHRQSATSHKTRAQSGTHAGGQRG